MSTSIKIAELERLSREVATFPWSGADAHELDKAARAALPALLRLARASERYAWMLSKDGPPDVDREIVAEWCAAREAFDFGTARIAFDLGIKDVRPITDDEAHDGIGWDMGVIFRCGCILEIEDAFNSLANICSAEHERIWLDRRIAA